MLIKEFTMKTTIDIPYLEKVGLNKSRFLAFLEIARHPNGISISEIAERLNVNNQSVQYTVQELKRGSFVRTAYEKRNGSRGMIYCFATPYGIDNVGKDMKNICQLVEGIRKEMANVPRL
jgi:predicted transcriptional regulator